MSPVARRYHSSERVITGSERSTRATSGMDMTSCFVTRGKRGADASRELLRRKAFTLENVSEQRGSEPAAGQGDRVQPDSDVIRRRYLGHDRREAADGEVIL